jgi:hypothetical protein
LAHPRLLHASSLRGFLASRGTTVFIIFNFPLPLLKHHHHHHHHGELLRDPSLPSGSRAVAPSLAHPDLLLHHRPGGVEDFDGAMAQEGSYRIKVRTTTQPQLPYCMPIMFPSNCDAETLALPAAWASSQTSRGCIISIHRKTFSTTIRTPSSSSAAFSAAMVRIFGIHVWA